ncbi:MAG: FAD-dependent oxidoreductase, partial [Candidatus Limnocylindrales bacterium]
MERFDFVIVGAGPAGEAAAYLALGRGRSVAIVERWLVGGACPFWACMPSKTLLHAAAVHALGPTYPWSRASARRDYMINRVDRDYPDDGGHVRGLRDAGAETFRGEGRLDGLGRVVIRAGDGEQVLEAANVLIAVGSQTKRPPID